MAPKNEGGRSPHRAKPCQSSRPFISPAQPREQPSVERYQIVIDQWGRKTAVSVFPRECDKPSRTFETIAEALAFAEQLRKLNGWPIRDRRAA